MVGDVSRMNGLFDVTCLITFFAYKQEGDGGFDAEIKDDTQQFVHSFIVDNIEIVSNSKNSIVYCIHLTGREYKNLLNHVDYSNYGQDEKKNIVNILKDIIVGYGGAKINNTFDTASSGVKLEYMSNGNDTVMSSLDYILQKQFFYLDNTDSRLKFIVYDFLKNEYGMFQFGKTATKNASTFYLSMNNSQLEEFISSSEMRLASNSTLRKSDIYMPISKMVMRTYDMESNTFTKKDYSSNSIINFFGAENSMNRLTPIEPTQEFNVVREASEWDNDFNVYKDFLDMLIKWDSIVVNTGGAINRKLMDTVELLVDSRVEMSTSDTTQSANENLTRYEQLQGAWYITKIRYIIKPSKGIFKQNVQLSRTNRVGK